MKTKKGKCCVCGCTEERACLVDRQGRTCVWADEKKTLCSSCAFLIQEEARRVGVLQERIDKALKWMRKKGIFSIFLLWVFLQDGSTLGKFIQIQDHPTLKNQVVKTSVEGDYVKVMEWKSSSGSWDELACFTVKEFRYLSNVDPRGKK